MPHMTIGYALSVGPSPLLCLPDGVHMAKVSIIGGHNSLLMSSVLKT